MATADELVVKIRGDLSDITKKLKQLEQSTTKTTEKVGTNFRKIASVAKLAIGAVVVQQLARGASSLVNFASHVEEMQAKSSVVFGRFTAQVRSELSKFGEEVGRSTFQLEEMASQIQDTFVPMGFARGEAANLSVELAKLATDVASFNNASDVETMRAFQSALVGNHETVRRFGVVITEATLTQELMRMGINKLSKDATNQEKVQARLNLLLAGTTDAQGDAARTADSFANQMKGLGAALSNLGVAVMTPLLPQLAEFVGSIKAAVVSVREFLFSTRVLSRDLSIQSEASKVLTQRMRELAKIKQVNNALDLDPTGQAQKNKTTETQLRLLNREINAIDKLMRANKNLAFAQEQRLQKEEKLAAIERAKVDARTTIERAIKEAIEQQKILKEEIAASNKEEIAGIRATRELALEFSTLGEDGTELKNRLKELTEENAKLANSVKEVGDSTTTTNERLDNAKSIVESLKTPLEQLNEDIADLKFSQSNFTADEFTGAMKEMEMQMKLANPEFVMLKEAIEDMGKSVSQSLAEMLVNGKGSLSSFLNIFKDFIKQLLAKTIELAIINRAINSILRLEGTTAELPTLPARAGGGTVQRGRPYMVGERGPEMFVPNTGGRIVANHNLPSGGGTTVVNQNLNFSTGIQNTVRAEVLSMLPAIQESTLQAVVDQKRRGGSFGQLMT
tara:strand:+ start:858 stop:2900 length:2043 start_codon:yes stop_codon:yes gene_type:complete